MIYPHRYSMQTNISSSELINPIQPAFTVAIHRAAHGFHIAELALAAFLLLHVARSRGWRGAKPGDAVVT